MKAPTALTWIGRRALEEGRLTLRLSGLEKLKQGVTTIEDVLRETAIR